MSTRAKFKYKDRVVFTAPRPQLGIKVGDVGVIVENPCTTFPYVLMDKDILEAVPCCPSDVKAEDFVENRVLVECDSNLELAPLRTVPMKAGDVPIGAMFNFNGGKFLRINAQSTSWAKSDWNIVTLVVEPVNATRSADLMTVKGFFPDTIVTLICD